MALAFSIAACKGKTGDGTTTSAPLFIEETDGDGNKYTIPYATNKDGQVIFTEPEDEEPEIVTKADEFKDIQEGTTLPQGDKVNVETDSSGKPVNQLLKGFHAILEGGKYTMSFNASGAAFGQGSGTVPVVYAASGQKAYFKVSNIELEGSKMSLSMIYNGSKYYFVIPSMRSYLTVSKEEFGEFVPEIIGSASDNEVYQGTYKVKVNGTEYICEHYKSGEILKKYYFLNKELKRIEIVDDGETIAFNITGLSNTAKDSLFRVPIGYADITKTLGSFF